MFLVHFSFVWYFSWYTDMNCSIYYLFGLYGMILWLSNSDIQLFPWIKKCLFLRNLFWANFVVNCNYFVYVMLLFLIYLETLFMSFEYSSNTCGSWICFSLLVFLYLIKCKLLHCAKCNLTNILLVVHILWLISRAFRWVK